MLQSKLEKWAHDFYWRRIINAFYFKHVKETYLDPESVKKD